MGFKSDSVQSAIKSLAKGEMIIVVDSENRENEGDLVIAAQKATTKKLNFMSVNARGLMCIPITSQKAAQLSLQRMTQNNDRFDTPFTVSVDSVNASTGVSVKDRLLTIKTILDSRSTQEDLLRPGHMFPLVAREGGILERAGHTEATIELLRLAKMKLVGVICEIMDSDGSMARMPSLANFAKKHKLKIVSIKDLIKYKLSHGLNVERVARAKLPTEFGSFMVHGYKDLANNEDYIALVKGNVDGKKNVLVRVHSGCLTGDVFGSLRCDCNKQLHEAMEKIEKEGRGVLLYVPHHEGRGIGIINKLRAYELQDMGEDTVEANVSLGLEIDKRDYGTGAQILRDLGLTTIRILTNNPKKLSSLEGFGLKITEQIPIKSAPNRHNMAYLKTKKLKLGHAL